MKIQGNGRVRDGRKKTVLICLGGACIMVYAVWGVLATDIINLTEHRMVVEVDQAKFDFGKVVAGSEKRHTFVLRNTGTDTIKIRKLLSSCSCTFTVLSDKQIAPKKEAQIEVTLSTSGYMGKLKKNCLVLFEQENVVPVKLEILADIYSPTANFSVNRLFFYKIVSGTEATKAIKIIDREYLDERLTIEAVRSSADIIRVDFDNTKGEIRCTLDSHAPVGFIDEKIIVSMSGPKGISNIEIPVAGRIVNPYEVNPERIFLGRLKKSRKNLVEKTITITSLKGEIPEGFDPTIEDENARLSMNSRNDRCVVCSIKFDLSAAKKGFFESELTIKTNGTNTKGGEIFRVPYSGYLY